MIKRLPIIPTIIVAAAVALMIGLTMALVAISIQDMMRG